MQKGSVERAFEKPGKNEYFQVEVNQADGTGRAIDTCSGELRWMAPEGEREVWLVDRQFRGGRRHWLARHDVRPRASLPLISPIL